MRNAIKYYYNIDVENLEYLNNQYVFDKYILKKIYKPIDFNLYNYLLSNNIYMHRIVYNIENNVVTRIDNSDYILLQADYNPKVDINTITSFLVDINTDDKRNWAELWERKVDYYEVNKKTYKDETLLELFPYYIGLSELAIRIYKENDGDTTYSICHNRLYNDTDFYSPDNIIIDYKVRDIAEYIKISFFNDRLDINELLHILNNIHMKDGDYLLLYSRLLFPTYFFDCIEHNNDIKKYSTKINQYERLLNKIYYLLNSKVRIPKIEWLIKNDIV